MSGLLHNSVALTAGKKAPRCPLGRFRGLQAQFGHFREKKNTSRCRESNCISQSLQWLIHRQVFLQRLRIYPADYHSKNAVHLYIIYKGLVQSNSLGLEDQATVSPRCCNQSVAQLPLSSTSRGSVLRQVHSLLQSHFATHRDLVLPLSIYSTPSFS